MQLIEITGKKIKLCSGMTEESFAKTRYASLISTKGIIAQCHLAEDGKPAPEFTFSDWNFDSIISENEASGKSIVFYEGIFDFMEDNEPSAAPLASISKDKAVSNVKAASLICAAFSYAAKKGVHLPQNGGGILLSISETKASLIFLPEEIFLNSVSAFSQETSALYLGFYQNPLLESKSLAAQAYMQAVIVYKALTGQFPFPAINKEERTADIVDQNFLPVEYAVNGIEPKAAAAINKALTIRKENMGTINSNLIDEISTALDSNSTESRNGTKLSEEEFLSRAQEYKKSQKSKIERKRSIRRNSTKIIAVAAGLLIIWLVAASIIKSNFEQPTTIGLSPVQVTECFFQSINEKDVQLLMATSKGSPFKSYLTAITNMHVADAASQAYTFTSQNQKPEKWFFYAKDLISDSSTSVWGITNLEIDGYKSLLDAVPTSKKARPAAYKNEEGVTNNSTITLNLSYYIVQTNTESGAIDIEYASGDVILSWLKNRWVLTGIDVETQPLPFDTAEFKAEYYQALAEEENDVVKAVDRLRFRYQWVPSHTVMENEEKRLRSLF